MRVTDADANAILARHVPKDAGIEKLAVHFNPDGAIVSGVYPTMMMNIAFESTWTFAATAGKVEARLKSLNVAGFSASKFKGLVLKMMKDTLASEPGLVFGEDVIAVDVEQVLRHEGFAVVCNLQALQCEEGSLLIISARD